MGTAGKGRGGRARGGWAVGPGEGVPGKGAPAPLPFGPLPVASLPIRAAAGGGRGWTGGVWGGGAGGGTWWLLAPAAQHCDAREGRGNRHGGGAGERNGDGQAVRHGAGGNVRARSLGRAEHAGTRQQALGGETRWGGGLQDEGASVDGEGARGGRGADGRPWGGGRTESRETESRERESRERESREGGRGRGGAGYGLVDSPPAALQDSQTCKAGRAPKLYLYRNTRTHPGPCTCPAAPPAPYVRAQDEYGLQRGAATGLGAMLIRENACITLSPMCAGLRMLSSVSVIDMGRS